MELVQVEGFNHHAPLQIQDNNQESNKVPLVSSRYVSMKIFSGFTRYVVLLLFASRAYLKYKVQALVTMVN